MSCSKVWNRSKCCCCYSAWLNGCTVFGPFPEKLHVKISHWDKWKVSKMTTCQKQSRQNDVVVFKGSF